MKVRKKPVEVEAVKWISFRPEFVYGFIPSNLFRIEGRELKIKTLEGVMTADDGDFIIKGVKGEFYPCKLDIFEQTYDIIEEII